MSNKVLLMDDELKFRTFNSITDTISIICKDSDTLGNSRAITESNPNLVEPVSKNPPIILKFGDTLT